MSITAELQSSIHVCVKAIFRDSARQLISNQSRVVYSLSSSTKWNEVVRVERATSEQPVRVCIMSKDGAIRLVFIAPFADTPPIYAPPKLLVRAIRGMLRQTLSNLTEEQRHAMLSLTMRVQGLCSTDGGVMTEGVSFKPEADSVTLVCRFGANRLLDISRLTRVFSSYTVDGMLTASSNANEETLGGISAEGAVCSKAGLLPLVLYAQVTHDSLRPPEPITGKRATNDATPATKRKRGLLGMLGL